MQNSLPLVTLYDSSLYDRHVVPDGHPERPGRVLAARDGITMFERQEVALIARAPVRLASRDTLLRVHSEEYVDAIIGLDGRTARLDEDTYVSPGTVLAALSAAGGAASMTKALLSGNSGARIGLSIGRPPGHHATRDKAMGFCVFNNVAVAAAEARAAGASKIAIVDWDAHHGNGTEEIFFGDPSVLYVSLHNHLAWPFTGTPEKVGTGDGTGMNVNISLPAGANDPVFDNAFRRLVVPIIGQYAPDILLVSAGFDSYMEDPVGGFGLSSGFFRRMASHLRTSVPDSCPIGIVLEGGYDLAGVATGLYETLRGFITGEAVRPFAASHAYVTESVERVEKSLKNWWNLD